MMPQNRKNYFYIPGLAQISFPNPLSLNNFQELLDAIINWLVIIATPIVVLMIIIAGFVYLTGGHSPESIRRARNIVIYTLIGYAIILFSKALGAIIGGLV